MRKIALFIWLYLYAAVKHLFRAKGEVPAGLHGKDVFIFYDQGDWSKPHGVVAFTLPEGDSPENYLDDLWGPFGYTSDIDFFGLHLYGRDTWGIVNRNQLGSNPRLKEILRKNRGSAILLAGVRRVGKKHIFPLNDPAKFILVKK